MDEEERGLNLGKIALAFGLIVALALVSSTISRLLGGLLLGAAILIMLGVAVAAVGVRAAGWDPVSEDEFDEVVERSERLANQNLAADPDELDFLELDPYRDEDFEEIVSDALDDLPDILRSALRNLAILVKDGGIKAGAYGLYEGDTVAGGNFSNRVIIYRDSLRRDFGHNPDLLREQITVTVRHELAHHLGADELGVRDLGLE